MCYYCESRDIFFLRQDCKRIDLGNATTLLNRLAPQDSLPFTVDDFDGRDTTVYVCRSCGKWVAEQTIIGEECEYVVQAEGSLDSFSDPDNPPVDGFMAHLYTRRIDFRNLSAKQFETIVGEFLKAEWRQAEVLHMGSHGGRGDGGVDYFLIIENEVYLVQVKHHPKRTERRESVKFIRELNGVLFREGKTKGIFVTSAAGFTPAAAKEVARTAATNAGYELLLVDRFALDRWVLSEGANFCPWNRCLAPWIRERSSRSDSRTT